MNVLSRPSLDSIGACCGRLHKQCRKISANVDRGSQEFTCSGRMSCQAIHPPKYQHRCFAKGGHGFARRKSPTRIMIIIRPTLIPCHSSPPLLLHWLRARPPQLFLPLPLFRLLLLRQRPLGQQLHHIRRHNPLFTLLLHPSRNRARRRHPPQSSQIRTATMTPPHTRQIHLGHLPFPEKISPQGFGQLRREH